MEEDLFKIDIDCDDNQDDTTVQHPEYFVDHSFINEIDCSEEKESPIRSSETCWNCNKPGHSMRDCQVPHSREKVFKNKRAFVQSQAASKRYHDNKFAKFRPGHHSSKLREALGLRSNELPRYIYMMRVLGYPPGWLAEAKITDSGIKMYNGTGKRVPKPDQEDGEILNKVMKYDIDKIIEFPGFNVHAGKGVRDDARSLGYPPMRPEHHIDNFIGYLEEMSRKVEEETDDSTDDECRDMELSEMLPSAIVEEVRNINKRLCDMDSDRSQSSLPDDMLEEGEISNAGTKSKPNRKRYSGDEIKNTVNGSVKRRKSAEINGSISSKNEDSEIEEGELEDEDSNPNDETSIDAATASESKSAKSNSEQSDENTSDKGNVHVTRSLPINIPGTEEGQSTPSPHGSVTNSSYGTPNVKSHSAYSKLPTFENFKKDISFVIDFENLPDSVGKYESMCNTISKVRNYMANKFCKGEKNSKRNN